MHKMKCQNCHSIGGIYVCKSCNTLYCKLCEKTVTGHVIDIRYFLSICPICNVMGKTEGC